MLLRTVWCVASSRVLSVAVFAHIVMLVLLFTECLSHPVGAVSADYLCLCGADVSMPSADQ
jgi:hypothetical protein